MMNELINRINTTDFVEYDNNKVMISWFVGYNKFHDPIYNHLNYPAIREIIKLAQSLGVEIDFTAEEEVYGQW